MPVLVGIAPTNTTRPLPLLGFGTELVWQTTNDTGNLAAVAAAAGSAVARYPGGTPSNYWDWQCDSANGTCCTAESVAKGQSAKCIGALGQTGTGPAAWADFIKAAKRPTPTVFDLNVVQTNASYQLAGLQQFAAHGVPIELLEMGNELFDVYQGGWSTGAGYRQAIEPYLSTMRAAFPDALVALVGHELHGGRSAVAWNEEVFNNTNMSAADAATIHIYTIVNSVGINNETVAARAPELLASAWQFPGAQAGFLEATIPPHYKLWVTEMGHRARRGWATPEIDGTFLEGLYTGAAVSLALLTPRVDMVLPYCLVCGLDPAPSFTAGQPWGDKVPPAMADKVKWTLTPKGAVVSELMQAVTARGGWQKGSLPRATATERGDVGISNFTTMRPLTFTPDLPLQPSQPGTSLLIGWAFMRPDESFDGAFLMHLGSNATALDLSSVFSATPSSWQVTALFQPEWSAAKLLQNMSSVVRQPLQPIDSGSGAIIEVPPYSVVRIDAAATR